MKILLTYDRRGQQKESLGGIETWMLSLTKEFGRQEHSCELFFFGETPLKQHLPDRIRVHSGSLADCLTLVQSERFDVVHAPVSDWEAGIAAVRHLEHRPKLVLTHHGYENPVWNRANCDALVGVSEWTAKEQQKNTDLPVQVVLNGVDIARFIPAAQNAEHNADQNADGTPIVAWVGRGSDLPQKRIDRLAAVAPLLHAAGIRLWIADPDGPDRVLPEAAKVLKPLAEFWGSVPSDEMPSFYQKVAASDGCLLCTSDFEGFGLAFVEAQACGCPVIGTDVRGIQEVLSQDHGCILYPTSTTPHALANMILSMFANKAEMRQRQRDCREFVCRRFSLERMADDYLRIYEQAPSVSSNASWGWKARFQFSPLLHYRKYVAYRWAAGHCLYEASVQLAQQGAQRLAQRAAQASFSIAPTLYVKPSRLAHLLKLSLRFQDRSC